MFFLHCNNVRISIVNIQLLSPIKFYVKKIMNKSIDNVRLSDLCFFSQFNDAFFIHQDNIICAARLHNKLKI